MARHRFSSDEERGLWARVEALWRLAAAQDRAGVVAALHPDFSGWVTGQPEPHDRAAAIASVGPSCPRVLSYELRPLGIAIFDGKVGVAHYTYVAEVESGVNGARTVSGRWSEVYLRQEEQWAMISVSGGPDGQR
ncbi:nuclear transport factor 2 family protein [Bosea sp. CS1GBMeth4]|uniref:nuclear transport factor 2 family protein n=1 Tax=Bosea sp. CS1GBMeth4 TaxID=1892849 RepID=UPI001648335D|nr:nuclear transport factor 2 family protein [Bosea sp. CS1GBMeth4]